MQEYQGGFVVARGLFDTVEVDLLKRAAVADRELDAHAFGRAAVWNQSGDDPRAGGAWAR